MKQKVPCLAAATVVLVISAALLQAQTTPDYKITNIRIVPFNEQYGKFEGELTPKSDRVFFNDLSTSLFVTLEVSGRPDSFVAGRKIVITVTEGAKAKLTKTEQVGLIGNGGRYYIPVFLYGAMCDEIKISARLTGQRSASTISRTVSFMCGE